MATQTPICITIYGDKEEDNKTYSRVFIPWQFLKVALNIAELINLEKPKRG